MASAASSSPSLRAWLLDPDPGSPRQAWLGNAFLRVASLTRNPLAMAGLAIIVLLFASAAFAGVLAPFAPNAQDLAARLLPPSATHWFGTDEFGRDIFSRVLYGSRVTLMTVTAVVSVVGPIGVVVGCVAGYLGGWLDAVLMRLTDVFLALPRLILALALVAAIGPGIQNAIIAIILTSWAPYARVARAEAVTLRKAEFIEAARLSGASTARVIFLHVLPLCIPSVLVRATLDMAGVILIAAGLGFLGLGAQPPLPEWGTMVAQGRPFILEQWWVATMPGLAICAVSLGFNLLGDGLRDILDPKNQ
jgi:peptide/nickel transport system permease protein